MSARRRHARPAARALTLALAAAAATATPAGAVPAGAPHAADASAPSTRRAGAPAVPARAPSLPALTAPAMAPGSAEESSASASPEGEVDPLVSNGLGSPLCRGAFAAGELSAGSRRNCETSGFVAAGSPTANFGIDVHIDTGFLGLSPAVLLVAVQDLFVTPLWMALVWAVHALVVMLEWCFEIDLLAGASSELGSGLRGMLSGFTEPWLAAALSVAAVLALYNGLIRRRVADTLGQSLMALAMMAGGLWLALDPGGTVGALGGWANQASLGTLAVSARGSPVAAGRTLADSMASVFAAAIEVPWCYLEFGDVKWCRDPARLDPGLRRAALRIADSELAQVGCRRSSGPLAFCAPAGSRPAKALEHSAELLRSASSNGALFLALPANGRERNSINDDASLLRAMCQSSEATRCHGPMAAQAEFRTDRGTWKRVGGLLLILGGVLGMLLLLGFIALRLLGAAIFSLLYLLLAPAAVLAPALGESGRTVFRRWVSQLLGAVAAKLLFALLLGVVLAVLAILAGLDALGWWTQWLLMSVFWWGAYGRRHQLLVLAGAQPAGARTAAPRSALRRVREAFSAPRDAIGAALAIKRRLSGQGPDVQPRAQVARAGRERARISSEDQVLRSLANGRRETAARSLALKGLRERLAAKRAQLARVQRAHSAAAAGDDVRRAARLAHRSRRLEAEIADDQEQVAAAREATSAGGRRVAEDRQRADQARRFLDAQATLPASRDRGRGTPRESRDYPALAGLAGYGPGEYRELDQRRQREARLRIDRELALRGELAGAARDVAAAAARPSAARHRRKAEQAFDTAVQRRMREAGQRMPSAGDEDSLAAWLATRRGRGDQTPPESSVMRDAREVAARRKRQLGRDRP